MSVSIDLSNTEKLDILLDERHTVKERIESFLLKNVEIFPTFTIDSFIPETNKKLDITISHSTMFELVKSARLINLKLKELGYENV
jgi:hypothetical protein